MSRAGPSGAHLLTSELFSALSDARLLHKLSNGDAPKQVYPELSESDYGIKHDSATKPMA